MTHQAKSFYKSGLRIVGYLTLLSHKPIAIYVAVGFLVLSEIVGIFEEL